ncbi:MAG TPA: DUF3576 domain-containing protein [Rickettsiales bacterium]|nr:DUF3576 domain-containing protein [Rickettsiales bacterium]
MNKKPLINSCASAALLLLVSGCGLFANGKAEAPVNSNLELKESRGSLTGGAGLFSSGDKSSGVPGISVNSYLWRATLDTLSFMPLASADPFGGVIITDWYEDPKARGERYKVNALITDSALRADAIRVSVFKQRRDNKGVWRDIDVTPGMAHDLEDAILTRARELRIAQPK